MSSMIEEVIEEFTKPDWIIATGTIIAIGVSILAVWLTQRTKKFEFFLSLWKEYSTPEMLESMLELFKFWNKYGPDNDAVAKEYEKRFRDGDMVLHNHRRRVSLLYQKLAFLHDRRLIPRTFRKKWLGFTIEVIAILYPIETIALPNALKDELEFPPFLDLKDISSMDFLRLFGLYNKMKKLGKPPSDFEKWIWCLSQKIQ